MTFFIYVCLHIVQLLSRLADWIISCMYSMKYMDAEIKINAQIEIVNWKNEELKKM